MSAEHDVELAALRALAGEAAVDVAGAVRVLDEVPVRAEDFTSAHHRKLWAAMEARVRGGERLDVVALAERVPQVPRAIVADVLLTPELGVATQRLELVRERSLRRQYLEALRTVAKVVTDHTQPLASAVAGAQSLLASWQDETRGMRAMDESLYALIDDLEAVQLGKRATTVPTGIEALDAVVGGLQPTLTMVGALPGVGKSALVAAVCRNLAQRGVKVGLVSLEDERGWLTRRLVAEASRVPVFVLANRRLSAWELERVQEACASVNQWLGNVLCDDRAPLTVADVVATARRMVSQGAKAVFVDHLGEMKLERSERHDLDLAEALQQLRNLAKAARVPVVVVSHLRRRDGLNIDSEPRLTDFAFSSGIERMARVALGLWRGERDGRKVLNVTVMKQTQGVSGVTVPLEMNLSAGVVVHSPASEEMLGLYNYREQDQ